MAAPGSSKPSLLRKTFVLPFRRQSECQSDALNGVSATADPLDSLAALPPLQYGALDPEKKTVRLLQILPGPEYEPIKAELSLCNLDDKPSYIALSYMWDQGSQKKLIDVRGTKFAVGESLWNFLQQYRKIMYVRQCCEKSPATVMPLWIDAIAIDQDNIQERNHQVSLMRDIYSGAKSVTVWLGLAQKSEELAFLLTRYPALVKADEMSVALVELLSKPYWSRVWVVQEFILAKSVQIWCGEFQADATSFESIWRNESSPAQLDTLSQQINSTHGGRLFKYRREFRHSSHYRREPLGRRNSKTLKATFRLRDLLQWFAASQSTQVHDKVYGFLGLTAKNQSEKIRADYTKAPVELLTEVLLHQCNGDIKKPKDDNYEFLTFLRTSLKVSRMTLAKYVCQHHLELRSHLYILAASPFTIASLSFISTISQVGSFVDHTEALQESTWKPTYWSRSNMHAKSLSPKEIQDLWHVVSRSDTETILSFADAHVPGAYQGDSEKLRQKVITKSTNQLINGLVAHAAEPSVEDSGGRVRTTICQSMVDAANIYSAARAGPMRKHSDYHHERYTTFAGDNGIIGLACGGGPGAYEIAAGDRICMFSGITDSNNAFIVRRDPLGKWLISGFAVILLPALADKATLRDDTKMCFHCHLSDILELQRCGMLTAFQISRMLKQTLRSESDDEVHRCNQGTGEHEILEFGL